MNNNRFKAEAKYYNVSANSLFITFVALLMTYYAWQKNGWTLFAKSLLVISLLMFVLTIGLFFSNLSIRQLIIEGDQIHVGKRSFNIDEIVKIECLAVGRVIHIHIANIDESLTLRMQEKYRIPTRNYVYKWCKQHDIQFVEK